MPGQTNRTTQNPPIMAFIKDNVVVDSLNGVNYDIIQQLGQSVDNGWIIVNPGSPDILVTINGSYGPFTLKASDGDLFWIHPSYGLNICNIKLISVGPAPATSTVRINLNVGAFSLNKAKELDIVPV